MTVDLLNPLVDPLESSVDVSPANEWSTEAVEDTLAWTDIVWADITTTEIQTDDSSGDDGLQWFDPLDWVVPDVEDPILIDPWPSDAVSVDDSGNVSEPYLGSAAGIETPADDGVEQPYYDPAVCYGPELPIGEPEVVGRHILIDPWPMPEEPGLLIRCPIYEGPFPVEYWPIDGEPIPIDPWPMPIDPMPIDDLPGSDLDPIYVDEMPTFVENFVDGTAGDDVMYTPADGGGIWAGEGDDTVYGSDQFDLLSGDAGNDWILGRGGSDRLYGDDGNDLLDGGDGPDNLKGGLGSDTLIGGAGDDVLAGEDGADMLTGGSGNDVFILQADGGADTLVDFGAGDRIGLAGIQFSEITLQQSGNDTLIVAGGQTVATVLGVDATALTSANFAYIAYAF